MSLLCSNSSSQSPENFHTIIESLPISTTLIEDSDPNREEIDIFSGPDDSIPPGIESDFDSKEDIIDNLLNDDSTHERLTFNIEPNAPVINNVDELNEDECFDPGEDIAKTSRKRLKPDKHEHGNEIECARAGRMLSKINNPDELFINKLTKSEADLMVRDITNEEIKDAIFGIGNAKAPGPDGYTSMFFKKSWDIIGGDVCGAVKEFFKSNMLLGEQILIHFGFHEKIIGWIMTCVTSAAFTVCVNGERYGYFKSGRGLRQGDPMLPYLFTLVMEILTLIIQRMVLKEGLMEFSKVSGLVLNMNKSTIFFGNVKESEKHRILEVMPFSVGTLPMKYMGVPLITKNIGDPECNQLVERVKQKVNDWKNKALSYAGRLQLIASVLASMHIYWASVFLIPKTTVIDIEKALKGFLWCHGDFKRGATKVAWKIVCAPKSQGGLGIKRLRPWNEALLYKSIWEVDIEDSDSGTWKAILNLRSMIRNSVWKKIRNGRNTNMWFDKWCNEGPLCEMIPFRKIYEAMLDEKYNVADMIVNGEWAWPNDWKAQFSWINDIKVPILEEGENDCIIWKDNSGKSMKFSIRSVWEKFKDCKSEVSWYKVIWYPQCNPRHAFIAWLAMHRRLATQDRIMVWCKTSNLLCPLCKKENDSHEHLFFKCTYSEDIWSNVKDKVGRRNWSNEWEKVASTIVKGGCNSTIKSVLDRMVFATVIYFIWNERNKRIFTQEQRNAQDILNGIVESIKMQLMCLKVRSSSAVKEISKEWNISMNMTQ
ncbi:RNA-directed DNA polymerase, eukaryota, reverse transcriptase zinc-binding domain protein [Tanacetum coccineum]